MIDWSQYPNFAKWEFDCSHTGKNKMNKDFLDALQMVRDIYGKPMPINSGYRDRTHPIEAEKEFPGEHFHGVAADVSVYGPNVGLLLTIAYGCGFRRFGIYQGSERKYRHRFVHLGWGDKELGFPEWTWSK